MQSLQPPSPMLTFLCRDPGWSGAAARLRAIHAVGGADAEQAAKGYGDRYRGERAAMIFDVVASPQRRCREFVLPMAAEFRRRWPNMTLAKLAGGGQSGLGLSAGRWQTIEGIAAAFENYRSANPRLAEVTEDALVLDWADSVEPVRAMPSLDPYCGTVKGVGVALFAYLRMRSGADALKPDSRVRESLAKLGFRTPRGDGALLMVAESAAEEIGVTRLQLDQLLWLSAESSSDVEVPT